MNKLKGVAYVAIVIKAVIAFYCIAYGWLLGVIGIGPDGLIALPSRPVFLCFFFGGIGLAYPLSPKLIRAFISWSVVFLSALALCLGVAHYFAVPEDQLGFAICAVASLFAIGIASYERVLSRKTASNTPHPQSGSSPGRPTFLNMNRLIPAILVVVLLVGASTWLFLNLRAKQQYTRLRDEVVQNAFSVKAMDEGTKALLAKARADWQEVYSEVGGPHSNGLAAVGLHPCVASIAQVCAYQLPEYSFVSPSRNKEAGLFGLSQLIIFAPSPDKSLYVSDDGHIAVMRCGTGCIYVSSDEDVGLRETMYHLKAKNVEPEKKKESGQSDLLGK